MCRSDHGSNVFCCSYMNFIARSIYRFFCLPLERDVVLSTESSVTTKVCVGGVLLCQELNGGGCIVVGNIARIGFTREGKDCLRLTISLSIVVCYFFPMTVL